LNSKIWYVYLAKCSDDSYYTGITTDLKRREIEHNLGTGSKYTRSRKPVKLCSIAEFENKSNALRFEIYVKKLSKKSKIEIYENLI
jgi:putative endonuclease